nr:hypothetical protein [Tanacetum cinerariifolium]
MANESVSSVEDVVRESDSELTKERLLFLVNQEVVEDAVMVGDYKRMLRLCRMYAVDGGLRLSKVYVVAVG